MYIFSYQGGHNKSITGNFQFFDSDHTKLATALNRLQSSGMRANIYVVLTGRMAPDQKDIVRNQRELNQELFLDLLRWFKGVHPGFEDVDLNCPGIELIEDPETENNTDIPGDTLVENKISGSVFYFTSSSEPTKDTAIYSTTKRLAMTLLEKELLQSLLFRKVNMPLANGPVFWKMYCQFNFLLDLVVQFCLAVLRYLRN